MFRTFLAACLLLMTAAIEPANAAPRTRAHAQPVSAVAAPQTVRVALRVLPPFVEQQGGNFSGFSYELWNEIADRIGVRSTYEVTPDVKGQLAAVDSGKADIGVGAISITADRELQFDFSQPILDAGLQILVRSERASVESTALDSLLQLLFSKAILVWMGIAVLLTVIPAHIIWLLERNHPEGIASRNYYPGILQAFDWGLGALTATAQSTPRHWIGRAFALLWGFAGLVFVAFYTAQLTATLTVQQFKSEINGPADLPGKRVGTIRASTSERFLRANGVQPVTFGDIDSAVNALTEKSLDAVVFDAPVLQYYATHKGAGVVRAVGSIFHAEDYGFALANGSDLRKKVNAALLEMREAGDYDRLKEKWFGKAS